MERWKNDSVAWVNLIAGDSGTWVMIACRYRDGRMLVLQG